MCLRRLPFILALLFLLNIRDAFSIRFSGEQMKRVTLESSRPFLKWIERLKDFDAIILGRFTGSVDKKLPTGVEGRELYFALEKVAKISPSKIIHPGHFKVFIPEKFAQGRDNSFAPKSGETWLLGLKRGPFGLVLEHPSSSVWRYLPFRIKSEAMASFQFFQGVSSQGISISSDEMEQLILGEFGSSLRGLQSEKVAYVDHDQQKAGKRVPASKEKSSEIPLHEDRFWPLLLFLLLGLYTTLRFKFLK